MITAHPTRPRHHRENPMNLAWSGLMYGSRVIMITGTPSDATLDFLDFGIVTSLRRDLRRVLSS